MTTTESFNRSRSSVSKEDRNERARRAVKVFRGMLFGLTSYARAITGKDVTVEMASGVPHTDGKKIYYMPPIALGDATPHERMLCDKRNEIGKLVCPACAVREEVLVNIYHEIGHIAGDTFAKAPDSARRKAIDRAIEEWGGKYAEQIRKRFDASPHHVTSSYIGLSNLINPFFKYLVNCIEDARVDSAMFKARAGVRTMMQADTIQIFTQPFELPNGKLSYWRDQPLNTQAAIACYLYPCNYKGWEEFLHPVVIKAFEDEQLRVLLDSVADMTTAAETYEVAFPVLARLRELGFFQLPEDKEEEKNEEPEEEDQQDTGDDSSDSGGEPDESSEEADSSGDDEDSSGGSEQSSDESGGQDQEDQDSGKSESGTERDDSDSREDHTGEEAAGDEGDDGLDDSSTESASDEGAESESDSDSVSEETSGDESELSEQDGDAGQFDSERMDSDSDESDETEGGRSGSEQDDADDERSGNGSEPSESSDQSIDSQGREQDSGEDSGEGFDETESDDGDAASADGDQEDRPSDPSSGPEEVIDTGADKGEGGIELDEDLPEEGTVEQLDGVIEAFHPETETEQAPEDEQAIQVAIVQGLYFEKPSVNVGGVREHFFDDPQFNSRGGRMDQAWAHDRMSGFGLGRISMGIDCNMEVSESVLGPALLQTRRVFTDNKVAKYENNLRSGRINRKVLGRRAWNDDNRLFNKKRLPGKRSYAVVIGIDVSGSTTGFNLALAKRAAWAQAELCHRAGVDFAMFAHSANKANGSFGNTDLWLDVYQIKPFEEPWDSKRQHRLNELGPDSENLDGHGIEYYRKVLDRHEATDKILLYYTDGKMPAANYDEELSILQREIKTCRTKGYTLLGVGIRTDSPKRHGLDTVQVDSDDDLKAVVMHLEKRLVKHG